MTAPPSLPALPGLAWSRHKKPGFATRVATHASGREVRVPLQQYPRYEFKANYAGLNSAASPAAALAGLGGSSLQALMGFFLQMQGQFGTFLYADPDDSAVTGGAIATGDGTTQQFLIPRTLGGFAEPVSYVTAMTAVYLNGVSQPSSNWAFTAPNMLGFATAPGAGVAVTADFTYAFQCRFADDQMDFEEFMAALWRQDSVGFRSIKANTSAAGAAIPSWYTAYALGGVTPTKWADYRTEGSTNHYLHGGTVYAGLAAMLTGMSGSFTRASSKYIVNASGLLASIASGALPFDYSPTSIGTLNGLLIEPASSNLLLQSNTFNTTWSKFNAGDTLTSSATTGPDGTSDMWKLIGDGTNAAHLLEQSGLTMTNGVRYTLSIWGKDTSATFFNETFGGTSPAEWFFNLTNGSLGGSNGAMSGTSAVVSFGNGLYRVALSVTSDGSNSAIFLGPDTSSSSLSSTLSNVQGSFFFGAQLEPLGYASSYISTTTGSASRVADSLTCPYTPSSQFTKLVKFVAPPTGAYTSGTNPAIWALDDGTMSNEFLLYLNSSGHAVLLINKGGVQQASVDLGAITGGAVNTICFAAQANSFRASLNGGAIAGASSGSMATSPMTERIGSYASGGQLSGWLQEDGTWDAFFATDTQLQAAASTF